MSFLTEKELESFGFKHIGKNVKLSNKTSIYNPMNISIGDNTRIDDFCILSAGAGGITIGKYVHIACYAFLIGRGSIILEDFCGLSSRGSIFSSNDDYSGRFLTNPTVPAQYTNVLHGNVVLRKHALIGAGSIIFPNVEIGVGAVVGALSLVKDNCDDFGVYAGCPARKIKERERKVLELEEQFRRSSAFGSY